MIETTDTRIYTNIKCGITWFFAWHHRTRGGRCGHGSAVPGQRAAGDGGEHGVGPLPDPRAVARASRVARAVGRVDLGHLGRVAKPPPSLLTLTDWHDTVD